MPALGRAVICPRAPALEQWRDELQRMMPSLRILVAAGGMTKKKRVDEYLGDWEVLLIGPEMLRNDFDAIMKFPLALFAADDIDQLRNAEIATSQIVDMVGQHADRYVIASGTPLQKRLGELHSVLDGVGGVKALGSREYFDARYIRTAWVTDFNAKEGKEYRRKQVIGAKNTGELKQKIAPLVLRRTTFTDVNLPTIIPDDVMLDLYPAQRAKYTELQKGVIRILREEGTEVKHTSAMSRLHYGSAICAGLAALGEPDAPNTSMKMDWIIEKLTRGDLMDEKVVIFANLKNTVRALQNRLHQEGVGFVTVWGENKKRSERSEAQRRFWDDSSCQVLLGTRAIEQSLNLQVSRHLVNVDMILNPARMEQLAGRIRRDGSAYQHVFVHNLLTVNTQEERYLPMLEREAALAGHIWDENSQLFQALSPVALLQLISG
jgi:SNF2 family DNA or RNA helicase